MVKILVDDRQGETRQIEAPEGEQLMHALRDNNLDVEAVCGGCCSCATCHIYVESSWLTALPPQSEGEVALLEELVHARDNSRLACEIKVEAQLEGMHLRVAPPEG